MSFNRPQRPASNPSPTRRSPTGVLAAVAIVAIFALAFTRWPLRSVITRTAFPIDKAPFPIDAPQFQGMALFDCPAMNVFVSYEQAERDGLSIGPPRRIWRYEPSKVPLLPVGWQLNPTDNWLAAVSAGGTVVSTARLARYGGEPPNCESNWAPDVADALADFVPDDKLVSVMLHPAYGDQYYRLHAGTIIPLDDQALNTVRGVQPFDAFGAILNRLAPCFPDDCGDVAIPTPIASVARRRARAPTPAPTANPASLVNVFPARANDVGQKWRIDGRDRTTAGRFIVVDVRIANGSPVTVTLAAAPPLETADGARHAPMADRANNTAAAQGGDGSPRSAAACVTAPLPAGTERLCTLTYELPPGARDPYLVHAWQSGGGDGGSMRTQLRLAGDGYPAPLPSASPSR